MSHRLALKGTPRNWGRQQAESEQAGGGVGRGSGHVVSDPRPQWGEQPAQQTGEWGRMFQTEHTQTCNGGAGVLGECRRGLEGPSGDGVQAGLGMGLSLGLGVAQPPTASVSLKDPPSGRTLLPAREPRPGRFGV